MIRSFSTARCRHSVYNVSSLNFQVLTSRSRVPKEQGVSQPVYEAWIVYCSPDNKEVVTGTKICGVNVFQHYDQLYGHINTRPVARPQSELSGWHLSALDRYQTANKRSLPSRLIRGRAKSYEQDLDDRLRKLPKEVQSEINSLLVDRRGNTSNRYHARGWSVVMMREQLHYRFNAADPEELKRHKLRFWKNKDKKQPTEFLIVIRGEETIFPKNDKGHFTHTRFGNPWNRVDRQEQRARERARDAKNFEFDKLGGRRRTRSRRRASPPPLYRRARARSITPPPPPPPPPGVMPYARAPRPYIPPPAPPLPRYPSYPPHPAVPFGPSLGPYFTTSCGPAQPPPPPPVAMPPQAGIPPRPYPYSQNLTYPPVATWNSPAPPAPVPFVPISSRPAYPTYGPIVMHPPPPMAGMRPDFPPSPPLPMPLSPQYFPAPPPPPMPSNLTTPTFTATASERSIPPNCTCNRPPPPSWTGPIPSIPCAACKASRNVARSDADVSELAVEEGKSAENKKQDKATDSGLGDDFDDDAQSLYD